MSMDKFRDRLNLAAYVIWGQVTEIMYSNRTFKVAVSCVLKNVENKQLSDVLEVTSKFPGCH